MLSHLFIGVTDFPRALAFYQPLMETLGLSLRFCQPQRPWAGWHGADGGRPLLLIGHPYDGQPATPGNGQMSAFRADSQARVRAAHAAALAHGGRCAGAPGLRPEYHPHYYGAYFHDPDGNKLAVACHTAERD